MHLSRPALVHPGLLFSVAPKVFRTLRWLAALAVFALTAAHGGAQGTSVEDPAGPRVIVPSKGSPQVYVLNADGSLQGFSTVNPASYTLGCGAPVGLSVSATTSLTLASDDRQQTTFQSGQSSQGPAVVGRSTPFSGSGCQDSQSVAIGNVGMTALMSAQDPQHQRLFVLASGGGTAADTLTSYSTQNVQFGSSSNYLSQLGQVNLDTGGVYTSVLADVDGLHGDGVVTAMRTDTSAGGVWLYNTTFNVATKVLGPDGANLPAIGAFIIHNPNDGGGELLVIVNQDGLTSSNLGNPPIDTAPFTIVDLGQLHDLVNQHPTSKTTRLPSVVTIASSLGYYAMLGAGYDVVGHKLYAVVGGGTSLSDLYRKVVSYDPSNPFAAAETVVADVSTAPLTSAINTQVAVNAAAGTMQILATDAGKLYSVDISGTTGTATELTGATFGDSSFAPIFLATNPLLGESYVASSSKVDVLTRPAANKMQLVLDLTGPEIQSTVGTDSALALLVQAPDTTDSGLTSSTVTITATPQNGGNPFTFATEPTGQALGLPTYISGAFPTAGIYSLVATFPGDAKYAPSISSPVVVAVAQALYASKIGATGTIDGGTGAGNALVSLTGTTYTPTGTITITSVNSGLVLATYFLPGGVVSNPISINFTAPPSTTAITATYSGDTINQAVTSTQITLVKKAIVTPVLTLTAPAGGVVSAAVHMTVALTATTASTPTGNVTLYASNATNSFISIATIPAASAFASGGVAVTWTPAAAGAYTLNLSYPGDGSFASATGGGNSINIAASGVTSMTLSSPTSAAQSAAFNVGVTLKPTGAAPGGTITVIAVKLGTTTQITLGTVTAIAAAGATGTTLSASIATSDVYTLTATYAGDGTYSATTSANSPIITVTGGTTPAVKLTPATASFTAASGTTSGYQSFVLYNTGGATLNIASIATTGAGFAQINGCGATLAAGANCQIRVNFAATAVGTVTGALVVKDNATGSPHTSTLTGTGTASSVIVGPPSYAFPNQTVGTGSVARPMLTVTNNGTSPLIVTSVTLSNTTDFEFVVNNCSTSTVVVASASCGVMVEFHPITAGAKSATVSFTTSASALTQTVALTGAGDAAGACADSDGDGLCDDWEKNGVWVRTSSTAEKFIDLPLMGADYRHKDVFIQADYMATADHTHKLKLTALNPLIRTFNRSPVVNPDGTSGIHLHVDCGYDCTMDPVRNTLWGSNSAAQELVEATPMDTVNVGRSANFDWSKFDAESTPFNASGRNLIFHHLIMAHDLRATDSTGGISRNAADIATGASDFIVSLGSWTTDMTGTSLDQATTLMHELGHNLGLKHGGDNNENYKPNYLSVMNYIMEVQGLLIDGQNGYLDYSRFTLPVLDEANLNEQVGMNVTAAAYPGSNGFPSADHYGTYFFCTGDDSAKAAPQQALSFTGNVNWNCDQWVKKIGTTQTITPYIEKTLVRSDVNADGFVTLTGTVSGLTSFNDWPALVYKGGAIAGSSAGSTHLMSTPSIEISEEQASLLIPQFGVEITGMGRVHTAPGGQVTLRFLVKNFGQTNDSYALTTTMQNSWPINTAAPASVSIAAGGHLEVTVTYTVPASAVDGSFDKLIVTVASQTAPQIKDSVQVEAYATTTPLPDAVSTSAVNFGSQAVAATSGVQGIVILNTGASVLGFGSVTTTAEFGQANNCGTSLAVGASCIVNVTFTPAAAGARTGTLTINDGTGTPKLIALRGSGVTAPLTLPAVTLTGTPAVTSTGQTVSLSVNVATLTSVPTGTVTITDGTTQYGQVTLDASGNGTLTTSSLRSGTYSLYASYSGDTTYRASNSSYTPLTIVAATPTTVALNTSAAAVATGTSVTFTATLGGGTSGSQPTGSVQFLDGITLLGTGTLNAGGVATFTTSSLANGMHSITAVYVGDAVFGASSSTALVETVGKFATTATLSTTASPVLAGSLVTLTANVTSTAGTPLGSVTFLDGTSSLGTGTLDGSGVATFTTSSLAIGTHSITAQYVPTGNYAASVSAIKTIVVNALPDYSVAANPTSLTVTSGSSGTATFTVTPVSNYAGTISFSCGTLPSQATCSFAPAQLVFAATSQAAQSTTLTFGTTSGVAMLRKLEAKPGYGTTLAMLLPLALLGLGRKRLGGKGRASLLVLTFLLSGSALIGLSGCGGRGRAVTPSTPAGSYTVPVTITDGTTNHSVSFNVTVK